MKLGLTYDDVLLAPQSSDISPSEADISIKLGSKVKLEIPILSAAMDRVTEDKMAIELAKLGGLGVIHRSNTAEDQLKMVLKVKKNKLLVGAAVGPHDIDRALQLDRAGADVIVVDCAHAHKKSVINDAAKIKKRVRALVIGGNIATAKAAVELSKAVDVLKVGVGPGSICTTRVVAGVGVPQLTAVMDVAKAVARKNIPVIADGGLKYSGDIVKALAAGARAVMLGSMLAGLEETPVRVVVIKGKRYKEYCGMGSLAVMTKGKSVDRYFQSKSRKYVPEGVEAVVPYKGKLKDAVYQMIGGLKSGMGYLGAKKISDLPLKANFIQITSAGYRESHPHTVEIIKKAPNY